ncbi:DUF58 domain-containing protein [Asaia krungthepensis]|uniref:DUF58 domain-containing protein n=1 Tax=Asaia krungthepensis TaxID=220990 RepID=UPI00222F95A6|nr:DUF58 domain-containing protein [Asaia krungthepensis]
MSGFFATWRRKAGLSASGSRPSTSPDRHPDTQVPAEAEALLPPLVIEAERIGRQLRAGVHHQHRAGAGEDFWQYRPAHDHEPAHRIDWRQSARSDQLWVREREAEGAQLLTLWCDPSPSMAWRSRTTLPLKQDQARLATLSLAAAALHGGERVSLLNGPEQERSVSGAHSLTRLGQNLTVGPAASLPNLDTIRPWGQLVLVSDFLFPPETLEALLRDIAARPARTELLCILDPAERSLPYAGHISFNSLEGEERLTLPAVETLMESYEQAMKAHLDQMTRLAEAHRAGLTLHHTDQPLLPALLALYARLSGGKLHA